MVIMAIVDTMVAMAMPFHTMAEDTMVTTMARGLPSPQLLLSPTPRLMPTPGTVPMAMVLAIMDTVDTMVDMPGHTMDMVDTGEGRRGLPSQMPQLNPTPRLMPNPGTVPMAMVLAIMVDTVDTMDMAGHMPMDTVDTGEGRKGPLRPSLPLSPLLRLILGTDTMAMAADTMDMDLDTMAMAMAGLTIADTEDTTGVDFPSLGY